MSATTTATTDNLTLGALADVIFTAVRLRRVGGNGSGLLVFGLDGTGGAWYSTGSRPSLTASEVAITYDHRTTLASIRYDLGIPAVEEDDR